MKDEENLFREQKIRSVEQIEAYKLSVCHPASAGIKDEPSYRAIYPVFVPTTNVLQRQLWGGFRD